jgi:hypothetical protein
VKNRCEELDAGGVVQACCGDSLAWAGGRWWVGGGWSATWPVRRRLVGDLACAATTGRRRGLGGGLTGLLG